MNALLDSSDLCRDGSVLASKNIEAKPRGRWKAIVIFISNDLEQLGRAVSALRRDDAELGLVPADRSGRVCFRPLAELWSEMKHSGFPASLLLQRDDYERQQMA